MQKLFFVVYEYISRTPITYKCHVLERATTGEGRLLKADALAEVLVASPNFMVQYFIIVGILVIKFITSILEYSIVATLIVLDIRLSSNK